MKIGLMDARLIVKEEKGYCYITWRAKGELWGRIKDDLKEKFYGKIYYDGNAKRWEMSSVYKEDLERWIYVNFEATAVLWNDEVWSYPDWYAKEQAKSSTGSYYNYRNSTSDQRRQHAQHDYSYRGFEEEYKRAQEEAERQRRDYKQDTHSSQYRQTNRATATKTCYEKLYVTRDAPWEVIQAAYKALALLHHPDKGGNQETMKHINAAMDELRKLKGK